MPDPIRLAEGQVWRPTWRPTELLPRTIVNLQPQIGGDIEWTSDADHSACTSSSFRAWIRRTQAELVEGSDA